MNYRQYQVTLDSYGNAKSFEPVSDVIEEADESQFDNQCDKARLRMLKRQQERNRKQEAQHD